MTGIHFGLGRKRHQFRIDALDQQWAVATHCHSEIRASDGTIEQDIATEQDAVVGEIIAEPMMTMARTIENFDSMLGYPILCHDGKRQGVAIHQVASDGGIMNFRIHAKEPVLHWNGWQMVLILHRTIDWQTRICPGQIPGSHYVVGVVMRDENGIGSQFLLLDEAMNPLPLPVGTHAGIDDETSFGGFVPNHIALFLKGVALKSINGRR